MTESRLPDPVHRRALGRTGLLVSEIGFGTWGLGGDAYGPADDHESIRALQRAFDAGVNFYDTSDLYGAGHSEELLGKAFRSSRDRVVLATKGGMLPHSGFEMPQDFSAGYLRNALEGSLRRIGTDYVDLYQLHSPPIGLLDHDESIISTLEGFQREGKIRAFGISVRSPEEGLRAIEKFHFPAVQVNFNLIDQRALEKGLFRTAEGSRTGVIVRTPLVFGFLTGNLYEETPFAGKDHRRNWPKSQRACWAGAPEKFSFLWKDNGHSPAQCALRFCLDQSAVSTVIPGMMSSREVEENVAASSLAPLSPGKLERILEVYRQNVFYDRKAKSKGDRP